ncbi:MAG: preprotein translocase subunit SecY [Anaerolineae bacterium SM23_84]|nr:MAG: preprotein translocase subunit SecY [Anaerolineae bacterium SM23_84]
MLQAVSNALKLPDLRRKLIFTLAILVIVRLAAHVPVPGIDSEALRRMFEANQLLGLLDMFSGGAMSNFSVMAMGVYPYITAQIILQLLQPLIPALEELSHEGEAGRNKLNQYMLWITIPLAFLHGFGQATILQRGGALANFGLSRATLMPSLATLATLSAGTMFAIWLGELIDEQGIGNGMSLIIFSGIVADVPGRVGALLVGNPMGLVVFLAITAVTVVAIIFIQEGQRRIPVQYAKRVRGTKIYGGQSTHIPLQVNSAGMIPLIFAVSILLLPGVVASYLVDSEIAWVASVARTTSTVFNSEGTVYWVLYFVFVVGLTYFYTDVVFQQQNLAEMLRKQGGFVPGLRPGRRTAEYLNGVLRRITLVGAVFLGVIAILPFLIRGIAGTGQMLVTSTGLLIVVGTVLDTMKQLEAQLLMRHYEGFIKR